jgi:hypothetical protein
MNKLRNKSDRYFAGASDTREIYEEKLSEIKKITGCNSIEDFEEKEKFYKNLVEINAKHSKIIPSLEEKLSEKDKVINDLVHRANKAEAWNDKYKTQLSELKEDHDIWNERAIRAEKDSMLLEKLKEEITRKQHFAESWYDEVEQLKEENKRKEELLTAQLADALEENKRKDEVLKHAYEIMKKYEFSSGSEGWLLGKLEQALNPKKHG